jgi:hypothetical protein
MKQFFSVRTALSGFVLTLLFVAVPSANHSWGGYHWVRTLDQVYLNVGDNVTNTWDPYLSEAISDWNGSARIQLTNVDGGSNPKNCRATPGRIEVCNSRYGNNGWLGIASIWLSGGHISQGTTKLNDTYFNTATYNTPAWRRLVTCQEIAHDFGLDHQDETFDNVNLGSCMDYTNDPDGGAGGASSNDPSNEHPNSHDFQELLTIYNHIDSGASVAATADESGDHPGQWGRLVRSSKNNRVQIYELDLGSGNKKVTHVFWADPANDRRGNEDK